MKQFLFSLALVSSTGFAVSMCPIVASAKYISGNSMEELFKPEDKIEVEEGWYACHGVERDEIVLVKLPGRDRPIVKMARVLPGDTFSLRPLAPGAFALYVNEVPLKTPHGHEFSFSGKALKMLRLYEQSFGGRMPAHTYFVFGTNNHGSFDSSRFGPVVHSSLLGRVKHR